MSRVLFAPLLGSRDHQQQPRDGQFGTRGESASGAGAQMPVCGEDLIQIRGNLDFVVLKVRQPGSIRADGILKRSGDVPKRDTDLWMCERTAVVLTGEKSQTGSHRSSFPRESTESVTGIANPATQFGACLIVIVFTDVRS